MPVRMSGGERQMKGAGEIDYISDEEDGGGDEEATPGASNDDSLIKFYGNCSFKILTSSFRIFLYSAACNSYC